MTKYREIIRLTGLGFSQRNIMASCGVAQKTVVKVQKRARELNLSWPLDESMTDVELQRLMFPRIVPYHKTSVCQTTTTSTKNCSATESVKSSCGLNTWRTVVPTAMIRSCILNSAITSSLMSRNGVLPCTSTVNPVSRSKLIGQGILQRSLTRIPVKS